MQVLVLIVSFLMSFMVWGAQQKPPTPLRIQQDTTDVASPIISANEINNCTKGTFDVFSFEPGTKSPMTWEILGWAENKCNVTLKGTVPGAKLDKVVIQDKYYEMSCTFPTAALNFIAQYITMSQVYFKNFNELSFDERNMLLKRIDNKTYLKTMSENCKMNSGVLRRQITQ